MSIFKKKQDDWEIDDDEMDISPSFSSSEPIHFDEGLNEEEQELEKRRYYAYNQFKEQYSEHLHKSESSDEFYEKQNRVIEFFNSLNILGILLFVVLGLGSLLTIGYFNTDIDAQGQAYIVPLDIHYERRYVQTSDKVFNMILDFNDSITEYTEGLNDSFIYYSNEMQNYSSELEVVTNELNKYTGVPTAMNTYHQILIQDAMRVAELINNIISKYGTEEYASFCNSAILDLNMEVNNLKRMRQEIDDMIFRNMSGEIITEDPFKDSFVEEPEEENPFKNND